MEARFARLEAGMLDMKATLVHFEAMVGQMSKDLAGIGLDVTGLRSDLANSSCGDLAGLKASFDRLEERASRLPTAIRMGSFVLAVLAITGILRFSGVP